jgi:uncharacterized protein (DUF1800 family)
MPAIGSSIERMTQLACAGLVAAGLSLVASPASAAEPPMGLDEARHLLNRAGFGATAAEIAALAPRSRTQAVDQLLAGAQARAQTPAPEWVDAPFVSLRQIRQLGEEGRRAALAEQRRRAVDMRAWWLTEMLVTSSPLTERMTLFWHNHFVSSQDKVRANQLMYRQNVLLRAHALGNFATLLHAVAKDPAMVVYLDSATNRKDRPNENFAREVMELFTLGEGQYTEQDIREAARAFTGWSIDPESGEFLFRRQAHDDGTKTVLGRTGAFDGDAVLDVLLAHPRTAEYITSKLWREFVSPTPEPSEVARIAAAFRSSGYQIKVALRELLLAPAFWSPEQRGVLVKSPVDLVVGTVRQLNVEVPDAIALVQVTAGLGQNLFAPPNVKGWPGGEVWINSNSLLGRKQFLERVVRGDAPRDPVMRDRQSMNEAHSPPAERPVRDAGAKKGARVPPEMRERFVRAVSGMQFDSLRWQQDLERVPGLTAERLLLSAAPVNTLPAGGMAPRDVLKGLLFDPMFQLK